MSANTVSSTEQVIAQILAQNQAQTTFQTVGEVLGYPSHNAAYIARRTGTFPVRVRRIGGRLVVFTADLVTYLQTGESQASQSVELKPRKNNYKPRSGRPTKRESLEAAKLGLTVKQFRAQATGVSHA
jgi:hypothetical protein